jgi:hypothetical protein
MFTSSLRRRVPAFITAGAAAAAAALAVPAGAVSAAAGGSGTAVRPPNPGAAASSAHPWAVGINASPGAGTSDSLVLRWNGTAWTKVPSPNPGYSADLAGVAATSASNAWAVGDYHNIATATKTLFLRWNGTAWTKVPSPNPAGSTDSYLYGVAATSASNAWAVGYYYTGGVRKTLILRWNGTAWTIVPGPYTRGLSGVAATSASNAWAVGGRWILHWNGTAWTRVPIPNLAGRPNFHGVAATSASNAWAVGSYDAGSMTKTLVLRWNGTAWTKVPSPNPGGATHTNQLSGVAATSASNAWAVGSYYYGDSDWVTVILRWNGTAWTKVPSPNPGGFAGLIGVAATSASNAWAVGQEVIFRPHEGEAYQAVVLHWNGTAWTQVPSPNTVGVTNSGLRGVTATG